jgi:hypothetical protein
VGSLVAAPAVAPYQSVTVACNFLPDGFIRILGTNGQCDTTSGGELRGYDCFSRCACFCEIVENAIRDRFIKSALIPIRSEIKLERLAFDTETVGHIIDINPGEIRLAGDRAHGSEIVSFEMNVIISAGRRVRESLKSRFGGRSGQTPFASSEKRQSTWLFYLYHSNMKVHPKVI